MKELFGRRVWVILAAVISLTGLTVLASGLGELKFESPHMIKLGDILNFAGITNGADVAASIWMRYVMPVLLVITLLLLLGPLRPMTGRDLMKMLARFVMFTLIAMLVMGRFVRNNPLFNEELQTASNAVPGGETPPQPFSPPEVNSAWEFWIAALIVIVVSLVLIFIFNRYLDRWLRPKKGLQEIAQIARSTLNDLAEERVSRNTIIRCYVRMNAVVRESRGITRGADMTPAEFAQHLEQAGLPREGIQGLTRVFEKVRYGAQEIRPDEIKEAAQCLTSILKACQTNS